MKALAHALALTIVVALGVLAVAYEFSVLDAGIDCIGRSC